MKNVKNVTFDEIRLGAAAEFSHTISQADIELLALVSGDVDPFDLAGDEAASVRPDSRTTQAVGAQAVISAALGTRLPGPGMRILRQDLAFKGTVAAGDILTATVTVQEKRREAFEVVLDCRCVNQRGETLAEGAVTVAAPTRSIAYAEDAAINIAPDLEAKIDIVQNAIDLAHVLGVAAPRVAILAAVETVNPKMPATLEAAALCKMAERGQITGGVLDGPLAFDNAISSQAARTKKIASTVAGEADILIVPDLEAGNMLAKQLVYLAGADGAGIVMGTRVPIVLTSRADSVRTRLASTAVLALVANARRQGKLPIHRNW